MHKIRIFGNDLKCLLLLKYFQRADFDVNIFSKPTFNFDSSYKFNNQVFDCGYHAVEIHRDALVWELLSTEHIDFNVMAAKRLIFIAGKLLPRNYSISQLGDNTLTSMALNAPVDSVRYFREQYVEKQFIESYTQNLIWRDTLKLSEADYLVNIQPWFYPKELLEFIPESIKYHVENRNNEDGIIAYPKNGGFGAIQDCLRLSLADYVFPENKFSRPPNSTAELAELNSQAVAERAIYVTPVDIGSLLGCVGASLKVVSTSFIIMDVELVEPTAVDWTEILVGDPSIKVDRISCSSFLAGNRSCKFFQIEKEVLPDDYIDDIEDELLSGFIEVLHSFGVEIEIKSCQSKMVPFRRFNNKECQKQVDDLLNYLEGTNENLVILNRSMLYRNFVDTFKEIQNAVERKTVR